MRNRERVMSHLTIYLDNQTEKRVRSSAKQTGLSVSRFIARILNDHEKAAWPPEVAQMAGSWPDFPSAEEIREGQPADRTREQF